MNKICWVYGIYLSINVFGYFILLPPLEGGQIPSRRQEKRTKTAKKL